MSDNKEFPLIVWQLTEDYEIQYNEAQKKLNALLQKWRNQGGEYGITGDLRLDKNGEFEFWLSTQDCYFSSSAKVSSALALVEERGDSGWWHLKELEEFLEGKGDMILHGMWDAGFKRGEKNGWIRRKRNEDFPHPPEKNIPRIIDKESDEAQRLLSLVVFPNKNMGTEKTFSLTVGSSGMMYIALVINPFGGTSMETMGAWAATLKVRGHLAKKQKFFELEGENIQIGKEKFIRVMAKAGEESYECVWPTILPKEQFLDLLGHLAEHAPKQIPA